MATLTDEALARRMLERAIANTTKPALNAAAVNDLMTLAASTNAAGDTVYTDTALNRAAATGWTWKAGLTSDQYDLGGGAGVTLDRSQWHAHCLRMAAEVDVLGTRSRGRGLGSVAVVSPGTVIL